MTPLRTEYATICVIAQCVFNFFLFSYSGYFFFLIVHHFAFSYNTQHKYPRLWRDYSLFFLRNLSVLFCPGCPGIAFCPYCTTHTAQTSMSAAGFKPVNPRKRGAADPRLRPLGHWDWLQTAPSGTSGFLNKY